MAVNRAKVMLNYTDIALKEYDRYLQMIEQHLDKEAESISILFDMMEEEDERGYSYIPKHFSDSVNDLTEEINLIAVTFTNHFRGSFLIQITSFIEAELKKICNEHSKYSNSQYTVSDLSGTDLEKCKKYLVNSANVNFSHLNTEWAFITNMYKIRNRFVHHGATISAEDSKKLSPLIKKRLLTISQSDSNLLIRIKRMLNEELLQSTRRFFTKLLQNELTILSE